MFARNSIGVRSILATGLFLIGACADQPTRPVIAPIAAPAFVRARCEANVQTLSVTCASDESSTIPAPDGVAASSGVPHVFGGQGTYVKLVSSGVSYAANVFSFNATVQNLTTLPMATSDGAARDDEGVRVFLQNAPTATSGSGAISVLNATGVGTFLTTNQSYYQYGGKISGIDAPDLGADGILASTEVSSNKLWQFNVPATVTTFSFQVYVAASTPVGAATPVSPVTIDITGVSQSGVPVNLSAVAKQIDVTVNTSGGGTVDLYLSTNCGVSTIDPAGVPVITAAVPTGQSTLSVNTAVLNGSGAPRFINGNYCIKAQLTVGGLTAVAGNLTMMTLANDNVFSTFQVITTTSSSARAISTINGLVYYHGDYVVSFTPVIYSSASPVTTISGYLTRNGVQFSGPPGTLGNAVYSTVMANGVATIVFSSSGGALENYTSLPEGDTLYLTSAIDGLGNAVPIPSSQTIVGVGSFLRFDNTGPVLPPQLQVIAPSGSIDASYVFSSGQTGSPSDIHGAPPVAGAGGSPITTTWYAGPTGAAGFLVSNSCDTSGLTAVVVGADLFFAYPNDTYRAKAIVRDAVGNPTCADVASSFGSGAFTVDNAKPILAMTNANGGASDLSPYRDPRNWSFLFADASSGLDLSSAFHVALVRNAFTQPSATDCVIGLYSAITHTCSPAPVPVSSTFSTGQPSYNGASIDMTGNTLVPGYYGIGAFVQNTAGGMSSTVTRLAAFDNVSPTVSQPVQQAVVAGMGTVTLAYTAYDNLDLATSFGELAYNPAGTTPSPVRILGTAGTAFGPNFDATTITVGPGTVAIPRVYLGFQGTNAAGTIQPNSATPTATVTVSDVASNFASSAPIAITTATGNSNILVGDQFTMTPTTAAPATRQMTTSLTVKVAGLSADPAFQSLPFTRIDVYDSNSGPLLLVAAGASATVVDALPTRTFTYVIAGVHLHPGVNTFYAVGRDALGNAVISQPVTVVNP